jgi:hypothetical protein
MENAGVKARQIKAGVNHQNSSSLTNKAEENNRTYQANQRLMDKKIIENDFSPGYWDLTIRRANRWD